ncbi:MAG TPA: phosphate ABC transporter permease PstA [Dehalococcoidia bacterium]|nr:phosphate ABC transporter permease PstA [Dehalococcoidia bacterium]
MAATAIGVVVLLVLGYDTINQGAARLDVDFLTSYPSRFADQAGLRSSILGTVWVLGATIMMAIPIGVGTAIWIEEFGPKNWLTRFVQLNLANLAGVPSIIYGILGLTIFVRFYDLGPSIIAGALTLALMIIPMTVIASQEAIRQVPSSLRDGALALGATRWEAVRRNVLPVAMPGIMTGIILAISRAAGETAALIMVGAFTFIAFDPTLNPPWQGLQEDFTTLPIQVYNWTIRPQEEFRQNAAAAIIVLMVGVLTLNLIAAFIRERFRPSL